MRIGIGSFELDVDLTVEPGELLAVLGPNGAGKTSLLRGLAGLLPLDAGRVTLDGVVLDEPSTGVFVPSERRPIAMVFQDYLLFPHLTVVENVAFGLRSRGMAAAKAAIAAQSWLERVGLAAEGPRRPASLSGGQAQRVALARALATNPALLLLDEPMAALDASTRVEFRRDLRRHLESVRGVRLLVTHDPLEAMAMADRLVILEHGRVLQSGTAAEVTQRPRSRYVADLVGVNLFRGHNPNTWPGGRLFGGLVAAQSLRAAIETVDVDHRVHSFHGYFLRPGRQGTPIVFHVDRIRDGRSFTTRRVTGVQFGEAIFTMEASFHKDGEDGIEYQLPMPSDAPDPDAVDAPTSMFPVRTSFFMPFELREIGPTPPEPDGTYRSTRRVWFRTAALLEAYAAANGMPTRPERDETLTMLPPRAFIARMPWRQPRKTPSRLTS